MSAVDVLAVIDALELQTRRNGGSPSCETIAKARAAVVELMECEKAMRAALELAVEKADRIGGDMKYGEFAHPGYPNFECIWYIRAREALGNKA